MMPAISFKSGGGAAGVCCAIHAPAFTKAFLPLSESDMQRGRGYSLSRDFSNLAPPHTRGLFSSGVGLACSELCTSDKLAGGRVSQRIALQSFSPAARTVGLFRQYDKKPRLAVMSRGNRVMSGSTL